MKQLLPLNLLLGILVLLISCKSTPVTESKGFQNRQNTWKDFRSKFLYHVQLIAVKPEDDNSYTFICSEPPENVSEESIKEFLKNYNAAYTTDTNYIGVDGWVKDLVISINDLDKSDYSSFQKKLTKFIYGENYKPFIVSLPINSDINPYLKENINFNISATELKKWFTDDQEKFYNESLKSVSVLELLDKSATGVYYSEQDGFVIFVLPKNADITMYDESVRKFFLDADLILGAISSGSSLCIVGRERKENIFTLPPLRSETIHLLASADENQISQSYERNSIFAGKLPGGKDWAPIYLSNELLNTEYGSLLNITDQMLKSWSENGDIRYENFKYANPQKWAFKKGVLTDMRTNQITYNWNTKAAVYSLEENGIDYVALNRLGSLPVTYIPEDADINQHERVNRFEQMAYDFFSGLNNKDLIRVNQYAALYQIFKTYGIYSSGMTQQSSKPWEAINAIKNTIVNAFEIIENIPKDSLSSRCYNFVKQEMGNTTTDEFDEFDLLMASMRVEEKIDSIRKTLAAVKQEYGDFDRLAMAMANPRERALTTEDDKLFAYLAQSFLKKKFYIEKLTGINISRVKEQYQQGYSNSYSHWIKTPSVVVSYSQNDSAFATGGHNIESRIVPVKIKNSLNKGKYEVVEEANGKVIYVNENDITRINSGFLKSVEYDSYTGTKAFTNNQLLHSNNPIRARQDVISSVKRAERGLTSAHMEVEKIAGGTYEITVDGIKKQVEDCKGLISELTDYTKKAGKKDIRVKFKKISEEEATVTVKSSEIKLEKENFILNNASELKVDNVKYDFSLLSAKEVEDGVVITLPSKNYIVNDVPWKSTATINVKAKPGIRKRVIAIINRIKSMFSGSNKTVDFYQQFQLELKANRISVEDISVEIDDCIICKILNGPDHLLIKYEYAA